jgi:hypothetical protein
MPKKRVVRRRRPSRTTGGLGHHWTRLPRWVRIVASWGTVVGIVAGAIVSGVKSWEYIEPWWVATHAYVNEKVEDTVKPIHNGQVQTNFVLRDIQLDAAKGKLEAAVNDLAKWQLELAKPDTPEIAKNLINDRLRNLTDTRENLNRQIRSIEREKATQH